PIGAEELARTPLLLREHGSGTREVLDEALAEAGLAPTVSMELGSTTAIKSAVASGAAPSVLSALAVAAEVRSGQLAVVASRGIRLQRTIRAVWPSGHDLSLPASRLVVLASSPPDRAERSAGGEP
ncbi:MAG TPA: LysR substrate-binding domain-containing protein, partial [Acidimicrobiales bacterium]|nr:LysR substrate-binding domain-containing protein [Acidimicrobiales bacterium]